MASVAGRSGCGSQASVALTSAGKTQHNVRRAMRSKRRLVAHAGLFGSWLAAAGDGKTRGRRAACQSKRCTTTAGRQPTAISWQRRRSVTCLDPGGGRRPRRCQRDAELRTARPGLSMDWLRSAKAAPYRWSHLRLDAELQWLVKHEPTLLAAPSR